MTQIWPYILAQPTECRVAADLTWPDNGRRTSSELDFGAWQVKWQSWESWERHTMSVSENIYTLPGGAVCKKNNGLLGSFFGLLGIDSVCLGFR